MAVPTEPGESTGGSAAGSGTQPPGGGTSPPAATGTRLSVYTTNATLTFTTEQIAAAGGPWPAYKVRVTPINANGNGAYAEFTYPPAIPGRTTEAGDRRITEDGNPRILEQ